ncbi:hypothetical protein GOBAR_DD36879 [Gossypium barbadense]|nr:hypothetical protein GOBAR_DD36879 [Gossypium barbadense]
MDFEFRKIMRMLSRHSRKLPKDERCYPRILYYYNPCFAIHHICTSPSSNDYNLKDFDRSLSPNPDKRGFVNGSANKISPWDAAKSMESAAAIAKKASELYMQCDRPQYASDSLAKAARYGHCFYTIFSGLFHDIFLVILNNITQPSPLPLYRTGTRGDACVLLEDDRKEQMALDLYHAVTNIYVKLEKYTDAVAFLLKLGLAADKCNATNSQCKAYLSAVIVYLYAHDLKQAEKCYNDCSQGKRSAEPIINSLYTDDLGCFCVYYHQIMVVQILFLFLNLDTNLHGCHLFWLYALLGKEIIKLARKLPTGDVAAFKTNAAIGEGEALDENDLT